MARAGTGEGRTGSGAGSLADSGRPSKGSGGSKPTAPRDAGDAHLCTFRVGEQRYALSTALVRELVEVTTITPVPRTSHAFLGVFNLRGEPMPLVDMALLLDLEPSPIAAKMPVIIVTLGETTAGARIHALGAVVANSGVVPQASAANLLLGFLPGSGAEPPVAVINPAEFAARLKRVAPRQREKR